MKTIQLMAKTLLGVVISLALCALVSAEDTPASAEALRVIAAAKELCPVYFAEHRHMIGTEQECSLRLGTPEAIAGWQGRWRIHGFATLRYNRNGAKWRVREDQIRSDPNLSAKQIDRRIRSERLIKSVIVEFDAEISDLDSKPSIKVITR